MRGGSVAVLVILETDGKEHTVLVSQARVPIGKSDNVEVPAGMLDGDGKFSGVAAKELKEETGLEIDVKDLVCLTDWAYKESASGVYLSPGGCDEFIKLYFYKKKIEQKELKSMEGKITGEGHEIIKLRIVPLNDIWKHCPDGKTLSSYCLYQQYIKK